MKRSIYCGPPVEAAIATRPGHSTSGALACVCAIYGALLDEIDLGLNEPNTQTLVRLVDDVASPVGFRDYLPLGWMKWRVEQLCEQRPDIHRVVRAWTPVHWIKLLDLAQRYHFREAPPAPKEETECENQES